MAITVLVVDDSKLNRQVLIDILQNNYTIAEAENGLQALQIVEEQMEEIAAVFLDINMPEMDGIAFFFIMSEKECLGAFPVLVVTSEQSVEQVAECFEYGASDYIRKPVNKEFVLERLHKLLELFEHIENNFCDMVSTNDISIRLFCKHFEQKPIVEMGNDDDKEKKKTNKRRVNNE